jgi:putative transposase
MMKRTNTFALAPTSEQRQRPFQVADACASLWNELNCRRRQSFFKGQISWEDRDLYDKYKGVVGSAMAQQIHRRNS